MNIWLILWVFLAVSLLGFMAWTFSILMAQKRAWRVYAEKRKLRYKAGRILDSAEVEGVLDQHGVSLFSSEHINPDARGSRKLTAIEVKLNSVMPVGGAIASGGMIPIMKELQFKQEFVPGFAKWKKSYVASSDNKQVLKEYLTDERLAPLCKLMEIKNGWVILVFKGDAMLLRIDIADPLHNPKKVDVLIKQMLEAAKILELKPGESKRLKAESLKVEAQTIELDVDEEAFEEAVSLELEEEGNKNAADQKPAASKKGKKSKG